MAQGEESKGKRESAGRPLEIMFMPIASPVVHLKRRYTLRPAMKVLISRSRAKRDVLLKSAAICAKLASTYSLSSAASRTLATCTTGARDMPSLITSVATPPDIDSALQPRVVDATSAPSVVASGM